MPMNGIANVRSIKWSHHWSKVRTTETNGNASGMAYVESWINK